MLDQIKYNWKKEFNKSSFRISFVATLILFVIIMLSLPIFLQTIEVRKGFSFSDPILKLFAPINVSWITFLLIYGGLIFAIIILFQSPRKLHLAILSYAILVAFRILSIYSLPLEPPATTIPLIDPFVQLFGSGKTLMNDLFFSGHTSTMFLLFLLMDKKKIKLFYGVAVILVASCVLIQHVHYTVDVLVAPFFAYCSYRIASFYLIKFRLIDKELN